MGLRIHRQASSSLLQLQNLEVMETGLEPQYDSRACALIAMLFWSLGPNNQFIGLAEFDSLLKPPCWATPSTWLIKTDQKIYVEYSSLILDYFDISLPSRVKIDQTLG